MRTDPVIQRLYKDLAAHSATKAHVKNRVMQRIQAKSAVQPLQQTACSMQPSAAVKQALWQRIQARIAVPQAQAGFWPHGALRLAAAFVIVAMAIGVSPALFLATPTVADSAVSLLPTRGEVLVSVGGLWQPVQSEMVVEPGMLLRTQDGEASILFHDDGVVRMDANTTIEIHDTSDRSVTEIGQQEATITLFTGRVWVQGLVPSNVRGLNVQTSYGLVAVNEGSVSIQEDAVVDVLVYNRRATVQQGNESIVLVSGERLQLWEGNVPLAKNIADTRYEELWPRQNLDRDAVHRREIAQWQQERRAARAGILPTSRLYSVKRAAETVDVLLTFNADTRTKKRIGNAQRRLDEAAALLEEDENQDVQTYIEEYKEAVQELASNATDSNLLQQSLTETSADVAAVQPEDDAYLLKLAVLEASTQLGSVSTAQEFEAVLLMDALAASQRTLQDGDIESATQQWTALQSSLAVIDDESLSADVRKEVLAMLGQFAALVQLENAASENVDPLLLEQVQVFVPTVPTEIVVQLLSEQELQALVQSIRDRIFVYHMTRSRLNQLIVELKALSGHPEEGRILRRLYSELPGGPENFPDRIEKEMTRLRWEKAADSI